MDLLRYRASVVVMRKCLVIGRMTEIDRQRRF